MIRNVRHEQSVTVVELEGRVDARSTTEGKAKLYDIIERGNTKLVLNLAAMEFIDSAGLGMLVSCMRRTAAEGGDLRLADVPPFCQSIFELTRLVRLFDVTESEKEAIAALSDQEQA